MATPRVGLCSAFVKKLEEGDEVELSISSGTFQLVNKADYIMVGPGTGIAPFRSIYQKRIASKRSLLFFGCRGKNKDLYFEDDFEEVTRLNAFSRDKNEKKKYVQEVIDENAQQVFEKIMSGCIILIAGKSKDMPDGVKNAIKMVIAKSANMTGEQANLFLDMLQDQGMAFIMSEICREWNNREPGKRTITIGVLMDVRIRTVTFNVADENPPSDVPAALFGKNSEEDAPDIFILAMQEVNLGLQVGALLFWDTWTEAMSEHLTKKGYYRIESIRMQGIVLSVFGKRSLLPQFRDVRCDWIGTGQLGFWGNKGAVAIRLKLFGKTFALINSHLPHGTEKSQYNQRLVSIEKIFNLIKFADLAVSILDHDVVLFQGDLNFRISNIARDQVLQHLESKEKDKCLKEDELNNLLESHPIIAKFTENDILFNPTYKYDKQSRNYDSSAKKRKPAWTDRILYKSNGIRCHSYDEIYEVLVSDHRPVYADFSVKVSSRDVPPLATISGKFDPAENDDLRIQVSLNKSAFVKNQDWIGIYRPHFKDYRDWVTFQWTAFGKESENSSNEKIDLEISVSDILVGGQFIAGYFSSVNQNLVALSEPFHVTSRNPGPTISKAQQN